MLFRETELLEWRLFERHPRRGSAGGGPPPRVAPRLCRRCSDNLDVARQRRTPPYATVEADIRTLVDWPDRGRGPRPPVRDGAQMRESLACAALGVDPRPRTRRPPTPRRRGSPAPCHASTDPPPAYAYGVRVRHTAQRAPGTARPGVADGCRGGAGAASPRPPPDRARGSSVHVSVVGFRTPAIGLPPPADPRDAPFAFVSGFPMREAPGHFRFPSHARLVLRRRRDHGCPRSRRRRRHPRLRGERPRLLQLDGVSLVPDPAGTPGPAAPHGSSCTSTT